MKLPHQPRNPSRADRKRRISQSGCQSQWPPLPWAKQPEEKGVELGDAGTSHGEAFSDQALLSPWLPKSVTGLFFRLAAQVLSACACGHLHAACVPATSHVRAHTHEYVHARLCRLIMQKPWDLEDSASSYLQIHKAAGRPQASVSSRRKEADEKQN